MMYGLRDMLDLVKLVSRHFKAEFGPDLVCIILSCKEGLTDI